MSKRGFLIASLIAPLLLLGACAQLSTEDRALLESSRQAAADAKVAAQQAVDAANRSAAASQTSAASAAKAADEAKAAAERADRMFQRTQRKPAS
jgi:hypothetical protein